MLNGNSSRMVVLIAQLCKYTQCHRSKQFKMVTMVNFATYISTQVKLKVFDTNILYFNNILFK